MSESESESESGQAEEEKEDAGGFCFLFLVHSFLLNRWGGEKLLGVGGLTTSISSTAKSLIKIHQLPPLLLRRSTQRKGEAQGRRKGEA